MPKFNKFISQSPVDYGAALQISGFHISNENKNAPTLEPFPYNSQLPLFTGGTGIDPSIKVASGEFFIENPLIKWSLLNPSDDSVFLDSDLETLSAFSGFKVTLKGETGQFVSQLHTGGYKSNQIQLDSSMLFDAFSAAEADSVDYYSYRI